MFTNILDLLIDPVGRKLTEITGIKGNSSTQEISEIYGSELIAVILEIGTKHFFQPFAANAMGLITGIGMAGFALAVPDLPDRARRELMEISSHAVWRLPASAMEDWVGTQANMQGLITAARRGDVQGVIKETVKTPSELQATFFPSEVEQNVAEARTFEGPQLFTMESTPTISDGDDERFY